MELRDDLTQLLNTYPKPCAQDAGPSLGNQSVKLLGGVVNLFDRVMPIIQRMENGNASEQFSSLIDIIRSYARPEKASKRYTPNDISNTLCGLRDTFAGSRWRSHVEMLTKFIKDKSLHGIFRLSDSDLGGDDLDVYFGSCVHLNNSIRLLKTESTNLVKVNNCLTGPWLKLLCLLGWVSQYRGYRIDNAAVSKYKDLFDKLLASIGVRAADEFYADRRVNSFLEVIAATLNACFVFSLAGDEDNYMPTVTMQDVILNAGDLIESCLDHLLQDMSKPIHTSGKEMYISDLFLIADKLHADIRKKLDPGKLSKQHMPYADAVLLGKCVAALKSCMHGRTGNASGLWVYTIGENHEDIAGSMVEAEHRKRFEAAFNTRNSVNLFAIQVLAIIVSSIPVLASMSDGGSHPPSSDASLIELQRRNMILAIVLPLCNYLMYVWCGAYGNISGMPMHISRLLAQANIMLGDGILEYVRKDCCELVEAARGAYRTAGSYDKVLEYNFLLELTVKRYTREFNLSKERAYALAKDTLMGSVKCDNMLFAASLQQFLDVLCHMAELVETQSIMPAGWLSFLGLFVYGLGFGSDPYWGLAPAFINTQYPVFARLTMSSLSVLGVCLSSAVWDRFRYSVANGNSWAMGFARVAELVVKLGLEAMIANAGLMGLLYAWGPTLGALLSDVMRLPLNGLYEDAWDVNGFLPGLIFTIAAVLALKVCFVFTAFLAQAAISVISALSNFKPDADHTFSSLLSSNKELIMGLSVLAMLCLIVLSFLSEFIPHAGYLPLAVASGGFVLGLGMILGVPKLGEFDNTMYALGACLAQYGSNCVYSMLFLPFEFPYQLQLTAAVRLAGTASPQGQAPSTGSAVFLFFVLQAIGTAELCKMGFEPTQAVIYYWSCMFLKPLLLHLYRSASAPGLLAGSISQQHTLSSFAQDEVKAANTAKLQRTHYLLVLSEVMRQVLMKCPCCCADLLAFLNQPFAAGDGVDEALNDQYSQGGGFLHSRQEVVSTTISNYQSSAQPGVRVMTGRERSQHSFASTVSNASTGGNEFREPSYAHITVSGSNTIFTGSTFHEAAKIFYSKNAGKYRDLLDEMQTPVPV